jgi:hypothetical protein
VPNPFLKQIRESVFDPHESPESSSDRRRDEKKKFSIARALVTTSRRSIGDRIAATAPRTITRRLSLARSSRENTVSISIGHHR